MLGNYRHKALAIKNCKGNNILSPDFIEAKSLLTIKILTKARRLLGIERERRKKKKALNLRA